MKKKTSRKDLFMVSEISIPGVLAPFLWAQGKTLISENAGPSELLICWCPGSRVTMDWVRKDGPSMAYPP